MKQTQDQVVKYINDNFEEVMHILRKNHHYHIEYYIKWSLTWLAIGAMLLVFVGLVIGLILAVRGMAT